MTSTGSPVLDTVELRHKRRESVLAQLVAAAEQAGAVREPDVLLAALVRAHKLGTSAVGRGFAVPHARSVAVLRPVSILGRSERGIDWGSEDSGPVQLVLLVLSPAFAPAAQHVERVTAVVHAVRLQRVRQRLLDADLADVRSMLEEAAR